MDILELLCLKTSPTIKCLLLKKRKYHMNDIFVDRKKYNQFHTLFHQLLENYDNFFKYTRMTKLTFNYIMECIKDFFVKRI